MSLESDQFFRAAMDALSSHVAIVDQRGMIVAVNRAWRDFAAANLAAPQDVAEGTNYLAVCDAVVGPDGAEAAAFAAGIRAVLSGERSDFALEYHCPAPDLQRWFMGRVTRLAASSPPHAVIAHDDITPRKEIEAVLRETEDRLQLTFDQAPIAAAIVSLDFRYLRVNRALCHITGYAEEEMLARRIEDITHPEDWAEEAELMRRLVAGEIDQFSQEKRCFRPDGASIWVNLSMRLLRDAAGKPLYFLPMAEDITARKTGEETLYRMHAQLAHVARLSTMGEMVAGIAHEVNQPLYSILNYAKACGNMLARENPPLAELRQWNEEIAAAAARAGEILRRVRDFVRRGELHRAPTNINDLIHDALGMLAFEFRRRKIAVELELAGDLPPVALDRVQIQQVLVNLLRNACDAMENPTKRRGQISVDTSNGDGFVTIAVADDGPGLPPDEGLQLFEPFVTTKPDGLGMGLAISRSIVESHGGRIWAASNVDGGATFRFTLPVGQGDPTDAG
jgi:PAS domain S-box-containing protein